MLTSGGIFRGAGFLFEFDYSKHVEYLFGTLSDLQFFFQLKNWSEIMKASNNKRPWRFWQKKIMLNISAFFFRNKISIFSNILESARWIHYRKNNLFVLWISEIVIHYLFQPSAKFWFKEIKTKNIFLIFSWQKNFWRDSLCFTWYEKKTAKKQVKVAH